MNTITREFAQDIIKGHGYGVAPSAVEELARIALASLESGDKIPDAYDIESFGIFSATEGDEGLMLHIEQFRLGTENCPRIGKENMVPKFALQAIINRLQKHCNSMGNDALVDIMSGLEAPQE